MVSRVDQSILLHLLFSCRIVQTDVHDVSDQRRPDAQRQPIRRRLRADRDSDLWSRPLNHMRRTVESEVRIDRRMITGSMEGLRNQVGHGEVRQLVIESLKCRLYAQQENGSKSMQDDLHERRFLWSVCHRGLGWKG
jgi:hypothetical protein